MNRIGGRWLSWYNRPRKFKNGIVWVRFVRGPLKGWGLWWLDTRSANPSDHAVAPGVKVPIGPIRAKLLGPWSA